MKSKILNQQIIKETNICILCRTMSCVSSTKCAQMYAGVRVHLIDIGDHFPPFYIVVVQLEWKTHSTG